MNYANPLIISIRRFLRVTKLNRLFFKFLYGDGYEDRVDKALLGKIKKGDVVWDIGANIGYYTSIFSKKVGDGGRVFAFEPHPSTFEKLQKTCVDNNTTNINLGLSNEVGSLNFSDKSENTINSIVSDSYKGKKLSVKIDIADNVVKHLIAVIPNIIKMDVEGYELSVLKGMNELLKEEKLRLIVIEVHHKLLDDMGYLDGARIIASILEAHGFKTNWVDPSHLLAKR
jgi:FkbM family methyltransferase